MIDHVINVRHLETRETPVRHLYNSETIETRRDNVRPYETHHRTPKRPEETQETRRDRGVLRTTVSLDNEGAGLFS